MVSEKITTTTFPLRNTNSITFLRKESHFARKASHRNHGGSTRRRFRRLRGGRRTGRRANRKGHQKVRNIILIPNCFFHFCWFVQQFPEDENNFQLAVNQRSKLFYSMEHFFLPKNIAILLPQTFVENKNSNQASSNTIHITNYFLWIAFFQFCDAACNNTFHQSCQFCHLRHLTIIQGTLCRYSHFEFS